MHEKMLRNGQIDQIDGIDQIGSISEHLPVRAYTTLRNALKL